MSPALQKEYDNIKTSSHLSLIVIMKVNDILSNPGLFPCRENLLLNLRNLLVCSPSEAFLSDDSNQQMVNLALSFIDKAIAISEYHEVKGLLKDTIQLINSMNKLLMSAASKLQITGLNSVVSEWISDYQIDLRRSRVIIAGAKGPRKRMIEKEFFIRLFLDYGISDADKEDRWIYYAEMLPIQSSDLSAELLIKQCLGPHELQKLIGALMFDSEDAMFEDLLADSAKEHLDQISYERQRCRARL